MWISYLFRKSMDYAHYDNEYVSPRLDKKHLI
jgi:hypothetical protein